MSYLLAVAVHDNGEVRLERGAPRELSVPAGEVLTFRVSYALHDNMKGKEGADVSALLTMAGQKPIIAEVHMRDRPVVDDTKLGDLVFEVPPLEAGRHRLHYVVEVTASDEDPISGESSAPTARLSGDVALVATASAQPPLA